MVTGLVEGLQRISSRNQKYLEQFAKFHNGGKVALTNPRFLPGITYGEIEIKERPPHFFVSFAGRSLRFSYSLDASGPPDGFGYRGKITCELLDSWDSEKTHPLGEIFYNGQGQTELRGGFEGDSDPLSVDYDAHAGYLIAYHLYLATTGRPFSGVAR